MESAQPALASPAASERVYSIDVFRGLTMLVMIFVNVLDMSMIRNTPWWLKHASFSSPKPDFMTIADLIAPAFLFIVGAAIPFAVKKRRQLGDSWLKIWVHILIRTASLLLIGVFMGNMRSSDVLKFLADPKVVPVGVADAIRPWMPQAADALQNSFFNIGISHAFWSVLLLGSFMLVWNSYPKAQGLKRAIFVLMRLAGMVILVYLAIVFRSSKGPSVHGMKLTWYVIGTIGWSYLTACIVYFLFRSQLAGMMAFMALLFTMAIGDRVNVFDRFHCLDGLRNILPLGGMIGMRGGITVAGLIVGMLFMEGSPAGTPAKRVWWISLYGLGLFAAGFLLRPLYGCSTPAATPTWGLYCCGYSCIIYALLYWLVDICQIRRWAFFTIPAGKNPLLAYFLSFMFIPLLLTLRIEWLNHYFQEGVVGIIRTIVVSLLIGWILTDLLSRLRVRLHL